MGSENMAVLTAKSSTIFVATGEGTSVYRSIKEIPGPLRRKLQESMQGMHSATILIADKRGREELIRALQGQPSNVRCRLVDLHRSQQATEQTASVRPSKTAAPLGLAAELAGTLIARGSRGIALVLYRVSVLISNTSPLFSRLVRRDELDVRSDTSSRDAIASGWPSWDQTKPCVRNGRHARQAPGFMYSRADSGIDVGQRRIRGHSVPGRSGSLLRRTADVDTGNSHRADSHRSAKPVDLTGKPVKRKLIRPTASNAGWDEELERGCAG